MHAWKSLISTWGSGEGIEEVCFHRDLNAIGSAVRFNAWIQICASASLLHTHTHTVNDSDLWHACVITIHGMLIDGRSYCDITCWVCEVLFRDWEVKPLQYLDEEELGFSHQWCAAISSKKWSQHFELYRAICTEEHALIAMTQQNADERGWAAVILLGNWKTKSCIKKKKRSMWNRVNSWRLSFNLGGIMDRSCKIILASS